MFLENRNWLKTHFNTFIRKHWIYWSIWYMLEGNLMHHFQDMLSFDFFVWYCICQYIDNIIEENWQKVVRMCNFANVLHKGSHHFCFAEFCLETWPKCSKMQFFKGNLHLVCPVKKNKQKSVFRKFHTISGKLFQRANQIEMT